MCFDRRTIGTEVRRKGCRPSTTSWCHSPAPPTLVQRTSKMSRPPRADRLTARGRPKRRAAAKANIFKYQLAADPSRVEENDLKRALQESLEEQMSSESIPTNSVKKSPHSKRAKYSCSGANIGHHQTASSASPEVTIIGTIPATPGKRTRFSAGTSNGHHQQNNNNKCDAKPSSLITLDSPPPILKTPNSTSRAIRTYSRNHQSDNNDSQQTNTRNKSQPPHDCLKSSISSTPTTTIFCKPNLSITHTDSKTINGLESKTKSLSNQSSVSRSTQTPTCKPSVNNTSNKSPSSISLTNSPDISSTPKDSSHSEDNGTSTTNTNGLELPVQDQYLKSKRESKNYAYVKMTALKVSTEKFPSSHSRNSNSRKVISKKGILNNSSANKDSVEAIQRKARDNSDGSNVNSSSNVSSSPKHCNEVKKMRKDEESSPPEHVTAPNKKSTSIVSPKGSANQITGVDNIGKQAKAVKGAQGSSKVLLDESGIEYDCSPNGANLDLSNDRDQSQTSVNVSHKRNTEGSWSLLGVPEEKIIYIRDDEPPRRLICYPAIKHVEGDVVQVRDSVLLRSGARKTDLPYIAKVCAFWEDAETGGVMMSLFWYYRPEHTEDGRKPHHLMDEIFASRHRDVDSVECIEDKCYVLTFNEYCRYRKRCKMEQVNTTWSLTDVTIPMSNESYPRRNRIPDSDVNPELVFCCRQVYDSRTKRLLKNPLINVKYGHI